MIFSDDLRARRYRGNPNPIAGHCYVASEVAWHLLGGAASGWVPQVLRLGPGESHWYLKRKTDGRILDLTSSQFEVPVDYSRGRGCGFLTKQPSRRAKVVMSRLDNLRRN